jgi:hypothetical protein
MGHRCLLRLLKVDCGQVDSESEVDQIRVDLFESTKLLLSSECSHTKMTTILRDVAQFFRRI